MIDGVTVSKNQFVWDSVGIEYHINVGQKNDPNSQTLYYMAFTSKNGYDLFMRSELGNVYDVQEAIIAHLSQYAVESGAVQYLELNGEVPQFYLDY